MIYSIKEISLPNMLTLIRLIFSPLVLPILLVFLLPFNIVWLNYFLALCFIALSLTDFFDGYFARRLCQQTVTGALLDPIADKFLLYSALIALLAAGKIFFYWVVILIGREFFVVGLRLIALEHDIVIPVSWWGKIKTVVEMICITIIIINPYQKIIFGHIVGWNGLEKLFLIATIVLSLLTAQWYYQDFAKGMIKKRIDEDI